MEIGFQILSYILVAVAVTVAIRARAGSASKAFDYMWGFVVVAIAMLIINFYVLPRVLIVAPSVARDNYGPLVAGTSNSLRQILDVPLPQLPPQPIPSPVTVLSDPIPPQPTPQPNAELEPITITTTGSMVYIVEPGDTLTKIAKSEGVEVADILSLNMDINPDRIVVGQELNIPTTIIATATMEPLQLELIPTPLPTPTTPNVDLEEAFAAISNYKRDGNTAEALLVLDAIDRVSPGNESAIAIRTEIGAAVSLKGSWVNLGVKIDGSDDFYYGKVQRPFVHTLLSSYEFEILEYNERFGVSANDEEMTIRCVTMGWMFGTKITLQAGHITPFGKEDVGDVVYIP